MMKALFSVLLFFSLCLQAQENKSKPEFSKKYYAEIKKFNTEKDSINNTAEFYYKRGGIRQDNLDFKGAITDYSTSINIDPENPKAWYNRGLTKLELERQHEAIADFDRAIQLDPKHSHAYNNRGICKYDLGDYNASIEDYTMAIAINSNNAEAYNNRGISLLKLGRKDEACEDLHKAYEKGDKLSLKTINKYCDKK